MKCVPAKEACIAYPLHTLETSSPCSAKIDDEHENIFAAILAAVKMFCESNAKRLYSSSSAAGWGDVEWSGHVVMQGGGPILRDRAAGE